MPRISLPPDPTRTNLSLDVVGDALPVRLVSDTPSAPTPPSERLWQALICVWRDRPTRYFMGLIVIILGIALGVAHHFSRTEITPEKLHTSLELGYIVEYPRYLVVHEDERFSITLVNHRPISLTHVSATLVFSNALPISSNTTVAQFEDLAPGERKTRVIHFTLGQYVAPPVQVEVQATTNQSGIVLLESYELNTVSSPKLKTLERWLVGSLYTGLGGILLWMLRGAFKDVLPGK